MINVFQPSLGDEEAKAVSKVFKTNWIGKAKLVDEFEEKYADFLGTTEKNVITTNCCSEALFASMHLFDIGKGDEVILPTISFVGAGNAVCNSGAKMVLTDVDKHTLNVRACDIEKKINPRTKAIMLLHYGGIPCEMDEIMALARSYNLKVIEDSACSIFSTYKGKRCGTIGDMGMWSFDAMKILVCGDGAAIYVKNEELRQKLEKWLYFGLVQKSGYSNTVDKKWWEYNVSCFGHRAIMNDITASIALEQLKKLPVFIEKRAEIANIYDERLKECSWLDIPKPLPEYCTHSHYFYHIQTKSDCRDELAKFLRDNGIYTTFRYFPLHRVNAYEISETFENADYAADHTLCLPIHQGLSKEDVHFICDKIMEFGKEKHF